MSDGLQKMFGRDGDHKELQKELLINDLQEWGKFNFNARVTFVFIFTRDRFSS